jgi:hypothetical protein
MDATKERARRKRTKKEQAAFIGYLTNGNIKVEHSRAYWPHDLKSQGHLWDVTFESIEGVFADLHYGTADDREGAIAPQVVDWLNANISELQNVRRIIQQAIARGDV